MPWGLLYTRCASPSMALEMVRPRGVGRLAPLPSTWPAPLPSARAGVASTAVDVELGLQHKCAHRHKMSREQISQPYGIDTIPGSG